MGAACATRSGAIKPAYFRLVIDWRSIQPSADAPPNLDKPETGCMREVGPCLGWGGVRDQLRALALAPARGRLADAGGAHRARRTGRRAPPAAASARRPRPRARPPRADALPPTAQLVTRRARRGRAGGRARCASGAPGTSRTCRRSSARSERPATRDSPSLAPAVYARARAHAAAGARRRAGDQQLVIGETAGILKPTKLVTSVARVHRRACRRTWSARRRVYTQHAYIGGPDPVDAADAALAARGCPQPHTIWITETGVGPAPKEYSRRRRSRRAAGCRALHDRLVRWFDDPRVTVAFQYTVREDDKFPTGLVSTDLTDDRPALAEWTAWGGGRAADRAAARVDLLNLKGQSLRFQGRARPGALGRTSLRLQRCGLERAPPAGLKVTFTVSLPLGLTLSFSAAVPACLTVLEALPTVFAPRLAVAESLPLPGDLDPRASTPPAGGADDLDRERGRLGWRRLGRRRRRVGWVGGRARGGDVGRAPVGLARRPG